MPQMRDRLVKQMSRKSRLSIPKVDQNPQAVTRPLPNPSAAASDPTTQATTKGGGIATNKPAQAPPATTAATNAPVDPRDPAYYSNLAHLLYNTAQGQRDITTAGNRAREDQSTAQGDLQRGNAGIDRSLADLQAQIPDAQRGLVEEAMPLGLTKSGWLNRKGAGLAKDVGLQQRGLEDERAGLQRQSGRLSQSFARGEEDRATSLSDLLQGSNLDQADLLSGALGRYTEGQLSEASTGSPLYAGTDIAALLRKMRKKKGKK